VLIERRWLKIKEAAGYLGVHEKSLYRACQMREIPYSKVPGIGVRIDKLELDAMLERLGISPENFGKSLKPKNND
jgi:excisionase family DNA binding protein